MIKVCIFAQFPLSYLSVGSGGRGVGQAATWLPQLAESWSMQDKFEIHWCVLDKSAKSHSQEKHLNQYFHRIPDCGVTLGMLLNRIPQRRAFRKVLRRIGPDLIHCWGTENMNSAALWEFQGPSILSMQGIITTYFRTGDLHGWRWSKFKQWEPEIIGKANIITSESQWGLDQVGLINRDKPSRRIEYGVYPSYYNVQWNPNPDEPRVLFVGGLNKVKGVDILIEGLRGHTDRNWKAIFAGDGYLKSDIKNLGQNMIDVLGTISMEEVQQEMSKSWCLVVPSRADTSPNVVKEARVIGLPVVGSSNGGHAEYISDNKDGYIIKDDNPISWMKALDHICKDYVLCRSMGSANHKTYLENFQPSMTATKFLQLYTEMAVHGNG